MAQKPEERLAASLQHLVPALLEELKKINENLAAIKTAVQAIAQPIPPP